MKTLKLFCASAVLSLALCFSSYAGDMQTPTAAPTPPPVQTNSVADPNTIGDETTTTAGQDSDYSTSLFIELLLSAFSIY